MKKKPSAPTKRLLVEELEPRLLLSADLSLGLAVPDEPALAGSVLEDKTTQADELQSSEAILQAAIAEQVVRNEIVFVDAGVAGYQSLIDDLNANPQQNRHIEIVILDSSRDGIAQITEALAGQQQLDAIHILSHGSEAGLQLGSTWLDSADLSASAAEVAGWSDALTESADILIYGCDLAAGVEGRALLQGISNLTGADVAASDDLTGAAALSGDWVLEFSSGSIEASVAFSAEAQSSWNHTLPTPPVAANDPEGYSDFLNSLGPLGYWRLSESSGTTIYDETGANNGTNVNGSAYGQTGGLADEPANTAMAFDGSVNNDSGDFVEIAHDPSYLIDNGTIQLWFNTSDVTQDAGLFSKDSSNFDTGGHVTISVTPTSHVSVRIQSTTASYTIESTTALTADEWHHAAFTFGSGGLQLFVDGNLEATNVYTGGLGASSGGSGNAEPIAIGASTAASGDLVTTGTYKHFEGMIDEVALFGTELTAEEIRNLYGSASQNYTIYQDTALNTSVAEGVLANDYDADNDPLTAVLVDGPSNAQSFTLNADGSFNYTPAAGFTGTDTFTYRANDGSSNSNLATVTVTVDAVATANAIWVSTSSNASAPGADGLPGGWQQGEVLEFGGVDLALGSSTDGDFSSAIDFDPFAAGSTDVDALHFVTTAITVGGGANTFDLERGDVLVSFNQNENILGAYTVSGSNETFQDSDLMAFRPDTPGDYSSGTFHMLLDNVVTSDLLGITLVEQDTRVGDADLTAGSFLLARAVAPSADVYLFDPTGVGLGTTTGTTSTLIDGSALNINSAIRGLELIERTTSIGGVVLDAGTLLFSLQSNDSSVGSNNLMTVRQDIFAVTVTRTGIGTTTGVAAMLLDGSDVNLDNNPGAENVGAIALVSDTTNNAPTAANNTVVTSEDVDYIFTVADFLFDDLDGDTLTKIQITELETIGNLQLSGIDVTLSQEIDVADIVAGNLRFVPIPNQSGAGYDSFEFRVHDGREYSAPVSMMAVLNATFDADAEGFGYADDTFGTSNPTYASGTYEATGGLSGGGLRVYLGGASTGAPVSGGWSNTFNLAQAETVTVSLQYRLIIDARYESDEFGEAILEVDGVRYGADLNNSLFHQVGDGNGGSDDDSGWLYAEFDIALGAGNHTLTVGAYNNKSTESFEWVEAYFDDINVEIPSNYTMTVDVDAVNDAPINTVPAAQNVDENVALTFSSGGGNGISIADVDANGGDMEVTLNAVNGLLTLNGIAGLNFTTGTGSGDSTMVFTGTVANINAALEGMTFDPTPDYNGAASVQIITDDQGNTGSAGPLTDDDTIAITVDAVNDAPINAIPGPQSTDEDATLTFSSGGGNGISIADVDANGGDMEVTLNATNGLLTLSGIAGLTFTSGDGSDDATMVFTGTIASINAALEGMTFDSTPDYSGAASVQIITNDQGNTGAGGPLTDDDTVAITVNAIDDAPINSVPGGQAVDEDNTLTFSAGGGNSISIADVDANGADMEVTLVATNGTLTLSGVSGLSFTTGDGTTDATMVFTGTIASINAALEGMTFDPTPEYSGAASVQIITDDQGNTGAGGPLTDDDTVAITVNAINDAPINSVPAAQAVNEDTALIFSAGGGNAISITDVDANGGDMEVTLSATNGLLTLSGTAGLTFTSGDGSDDTTMVFTGTIASINAALEGMTFDPTPEYNGAASLQIITDDQGSTGAGGPLTDDDTVAITVNAIDDAPINSVPGGQAVDEDNTLTFSAGGGNAISIADVDANGADMEVTLVATNGTLTLSGISGLSFTTGDGTTDVTMVFTGTIASINAALEGMTFNPTPDFAGAASLQIITDDQGNTGAGGPLTDDDTIAITVNAINDAPINSVPGAQAVNEDTVLIFSAGGGNAISITDVDANGGDMEVTLNATNGLLTLSGTAGLTFTSGDGSDDATMVFTGTVANINAALEGMTFDPTTDYNGAASVQLITDDQGNTGTGGPLTGDDTVAITVNAIDDAPINSVPGGQTVDEESTLTFSAGGGNGITISDVDANGADMGVTLNATNGLLTLSATAGLTFTSGDGTADATMVFTGTIASINAALEGMTFDPTPDFAGAASLQIITDDQGNTGAGGPLMDDDTIAITVNGINDAPINSVPGVQSVDEDNTLTFSAGGGNAITISDVDANGADMEVTLVATNGTLTLSGVSGLSFTTGDGTTDATMVFTGTVANINAALEGMTFDPTPDYNGAASVQIITDDQGNTGSGGPLTDDDTIAITVNVIDDAPVNVVPAAQSVDEDTTLTFSAGSGNAIIISDVDANGADMEVTLVASNGTLTLSGVSGLSFTTGDGTTDATMVFTGTIASINAALEGMSFDPTPDYSGAASVQIITDDQGNTGAGGPLSDDDTVAITVNAIDDAPINSVPGGQSVDEDSTLTFSVGGGNAISITDVDASGGDMEVTLSATNGLLTLSGTAGLTFTSGDGSDDATMVFTGTIASINAAFEGMTFDPTPDYNGAASVQIITDDQGNTGTGGPLTDDDTVAITVNAIDDAPINNVPGGQSVDEDNTLTFSAGGGNAITISDVDANGADMGVTLNATNGLLTLSATAGLTFTSGDGTADATMVFTGTIASINAALEGMTFDPAPEYIGAASVRIITDDQGSTGAGGPLSDDDTVAITVNAIDDAPVNLVPAAQSVDEDNTLTFSAGGGNAITISDVDANGADLEVTLVATNGTLTLSGVSGLSFTTGDGSDDATMVFTGTIASINAALEGMMFDPTPDYSGAASVQIITDDQGNTGAGGPLTDDDTIAITVNAINDAPINSVPAAQAVNEDTALIFSAGGGNAISITDVDANGGDMEVTLSATNGLLTLSGTAGLTFTGGDGAADATMVFTGTVANINAALEGMTFDPTPEYNGAASVRIITDDQGSTGAGGPLTDDDTVAITVNAIDDAPINSVPGGQAVDEESTLTFSTGSGNAITISDIDANGGDMEVTLVATNGTLTLGGVSGLSFTTGDGSDDTTMVFTGSIADINAALEGMTFDPTPDFAGAASLQIITDDQGNTGAGGPLTDDDTIAITVNAINDAPINTVPGGQAVDEDNTLTFSAGGGNSISIADVDANGADMEVTLVATNGTLTLSGVSGLSFTTGDGTIDATMVFTGTVANINAALEGMTFDPTPDYNGAASVQIITDDQGNTGTGGPLSDDDTVAITVNAIDDAPINSVPGGQSVDEDSTLTFSAGGGNAITISDVDANGGDMEVTLNATNGLLTLSGIAGLTFTSGDGSDDTTMVFTGTIASINAALEGMTFDPTPEYNGAASVQIITDDQGNTGAGGPLTDDDTIAITVNAIDDAPINSVPGGQSVDEDNTLTFSAGDGNAITISDIDANGADMEVTLVASNGTLTLGGVSGLSFTTGDGSDDATMVFTGTIASINAALEGMTFDPTPDYNGAASVQIITDDQGNTGAGGPLTDDDTVAITVNAIDDAPVNVVPAAQSVDEDTTLTFSAGGGNAITISDVDANGADLEVTLVATNGTLTLSGVSGLSFTTGDGSDDATMVFTGTIASINAALEGMMFDPTPDYNGAASVQIITDDQGNTGVGGPLTDDDTVAITVNAIDDAPVNVVPAAQSVDEDNTLTFSAGGGNAITISDVDANGADLEVTLVATNGTLTLSGVSGLSFTTGDGSDDTTMVFTGTIASINAALEGMTFDPTPDYNGAASVQIITDDQGNTGAGGPLTDDDTVAITVNAVDDAPINSVPGGQSVDEDNTLTFSTGGGNAISIADIDANGADMEVTLNATNGLLTLSGTAGLTFSIGDGSDDTTIVFTGTVASINAALEGMTFDPTPDYNGAASVQIITDDQGNTGAGGPLTDDDTVAITVNAIDDAPVNSVPGAQAVNEDTALIFSAGGGNAISITDVDANGGDMEVTLVATNGTLTLSGVSGLSFTTGDGTTDATMVFTGTIANINAALEGMTFDPTPDYNGAASVQIITDDQGNTGTGGPLTDDDTVAITINAIDDAPINSVPGGQSVDEDNTLTFSAGGGNAITITDVDANGADMEVTLNATNGLLTLSATAGLTFTSGDGSDDATMVFTGTIASINAALEGMTFDPTPDYNGAASVQIITDDQGNTGADGPLTDDDTVAITVNAIDDAPINSVPGGQAVDEDNTLTFSAGDGNAITISDVDANGGDMEVTLNATNGLLTLSGTAGLTFTSGDGSDDATMVFTGTIASINAALEGMMFDPTPDYNGAASVQIITDDQGNTGAGGPLTDDDTVAITVNAIDDAPVNVVPAAQSVDEDTTLTFSVGGGNAISITDVDANGGDMEVTLSATNGLLTLSGTAGLTFTSGDGTADATMVFTGTVANINAALEGMTFDPTPDYNGAASVQIITDDQGNTGTGGPLTDDDTVAITVNAIDDAPINSVPGGQAVDEESTLTFSAGGGNAITISDIDANGADMEVTLVATNGTLTLGGVSGLSFTTGDGSDDATMVFTGTIADINAALEGMTFDPTPDFAGGASLQIITDDQGNTGAGGPLTDDDTIAITVNAINDAPINSVPGAQAVNEDTALIFSAGGGNAISITDVDANGGDMEVTLNATNGLLTLSGTAGLTFTSGDGSDDATMVFTGTVANINAALEGMTFDPTPDYNGAASVQIITDDQGNTGAGGPLTDDDTVAITILDDNDAPVSTVPGPQAVDEESTLTFSAGGGNAITISDVDANGGDMEVTLNATNGLLTLSGTAGLAFTSGDGSDDAMMVFTGTIANINAALEGMTFDPTPDFAGVASLQIITDDQGNTGAGGILTDSDTVAITVNAINDAPINSVPGAQAVNEDTALIFSAGGGNAISIADVDANGGDMEVTLIATNGLLTLSGTAGLTFTSGDGTADATMVFTGTIANINAALEGMTFDPVPQFNGSASVQIITDDQGNTGSGGPLTDNDTVSITVFDDNDAPVNTVPGPQTIDEDNSLTFSMGGGNAISIADVDANGGDMEVTLNATNGLLTLSGIAGLTFTSGDGSDDATMVFTGTIANINAALEGMTFDPTPEYNGTASVQIITDDQSNTGAGGPLTDDDTVAITINAINDVPIVLDTSISTAEDTPYLSAIGVNDLLIGSSDADGDSLSVTTTPITAPSNGTLVLNSDGTFTYTPDANFFGSDAFVYEVTDANGGIVQATVTIDVTSVNDAPTILGSSITLDEDVPYAAMLGVDDLLINSFDVDGDALTVSATPVTGPSSGVLILNGDGSFTYTPDADANGPDSFVYEITDVNGASAQAVVAITVNSINDAPVASDDVLNAQVNSSGTIDGDDLMANDIDVDGDTITLDSLTQPSNGFVSLNPDGTIVYVPDDGFIGSDSFTYTISDSSGMQSTGLVVIDVAAPGGGNNSGNDDSDSEDVINLEPIDSSTLEEGIEEPAAATTAFAPTVQLLVTPEVEFSDLDVSSVEQPVDLSLLIDGEIDDSAAEILITKAQSLYNQSLNSIAGLALGSFELASLDPASLAQALDSLRREISGLDNSEEFDNLFVLQVSTGLGAVLSVGFVSWILRGGALAATLLSTVPMWKGFDPLPMLMGRRRDDDEEDRETNEGTDELAATTELRELHLERMFSMSGRFKTDEAIGKKSK